jgi:4-amino-4-deoxy-L-arabinose transferase-like glycosyltransferase
MEETPAPAGTRGPRGLVSHLPFYLLLAVYLAYLAHFAATLPLMEWDESRTALNADEMVRGGDWMALHYDGELDHYNLKPPLFTWVLAATLRVFGWSELMARLPSVLFGLATAALVYHFLVRLTGDRFTAAAAGLGLVTAPGFHGLHAMLSADVDVALAGFATLAFVASWFAFVEERRGWLLVLGAALGLGFMTKSLVGLIPLGTAAFAFLLHPVRKSLLDGRLAAGAALALAIALPWLLARECLYPDGYLRLMVGRDILERSRTVLEGHAGDSMYYARSSAEHLGLWTIAALLAATAVATAPFLPGKEAGAGPDRGPAFRAGLLCIATVALYFAAFTASASKLPWYMLPSYPVAFIGIGIGFSSFADPIPRGLRRGGLAILLLVNLVAIAVYDARFSSGVPEVDRLLFPFREEVRHRVLVTAGGLRPNAFVLARLYSDGRTRAFAEGTPLGEILAAAPGAEILLATDVRPYAGNPRLAPLRLTGIPGTALRAGLFRILPP